MVSFIRTCEPGSVFPEIERLSRTTSDNVALCVDRELMSCLTGPSSITGCAVAHNGVSTEANKNKAKNTEMVRCRRLLSATFINPRSLESFTSAFCQIIT